MTAFVARLQERQLLKAALEDRGPRLVVVRGPSGVGKTALVERALRDRAPAEPILGRAKYAEQSTSAGLRPVVDALSQAVDVALGRLYDPVAGAASLRNLVGAQYETLLGAGFGAAGLAASTAPPAATALQSREGTVRLVEALVRVLQWLEGFALPVVIFIDDWHRAPNEAVGFVYACSRRDDTSTLKLILAARSEGTISYPDTASILELAPLANADQFDLLSQTLKDPAKAHAVLDWLGDHANGLPFDLTEMALALHRALAFTGSGASLRVDPVRAAMIDHRDIDKIIAQRARTLSPPVLRLGIAAALWGDRARLDVLARCLGEPLPLARTAADELQSNGLLHVEGDELALPHDRVRASLLQVPQAVDLRALAHAMSDVLLGERSGIDRQTALRLKIVGGIDEVRDPRLAGMFAAETVAARLVAQFDLAADFGEAAWSIFQRLGSSDSGDRLMVLREACFAAAHRRQTAATRERCTLLIAVAADKAELANAYERSVIAMRLAGTSADAWTFCREGFASFGVRLPDRVSNLHLLVAMLVWKIFGRKPRRLIHHDARTEEAVNSFASSATYAIWERGPRHAAYMGIQMATRARLMGYDSALWLSVDALVCSSMKNYQAAAEFGDRAMAALAQLKVGRGMTIHRAITFGKLWRDPRASLIETNRQVYDFCIAESNLVGAANAVLNEARWTWRCAPTLDEVVATLEDTDNKARRLGDTRTSAAIAQLAELVRRLRLPEPLSRHLTNTSAQGQVGEVPITFVEYLSLTEDWPAILRITQEAHAKRHTLDSHPIGVNWRFYENLARLKIGLSLNRSDLKFIERAAKANPPDQLGKLLLLRAEQSFRLGKKDCLRAYSDAIEAMQNGSSRLELGLAAECAAATARELGDHAALERFRAVAIATWSAWGAFGKLAMYDTTQLDASIRARLAEAEAQTAMAQRGERAKSRFLAEIGHELRTPLQAMQGLLDLATERPDEIDLGEIREVFGSLKTVVDDLTELGALGAQAPLNLRPTDLASLLSSELAFVRVAARQKGLELSSDLTVLHGRGFDVDPDRVRQVTRNLLSNAIKYTEEGTVALRANIGEGPDSRIRIALAFEDTGPGIPEERLPHLFEPFDRAGRVDSRGLGLGLSLSRRIAQRMDGSLMAENRGEGGARFVFSFVAAERESLPLQKIAPQVVSRSLSILIVEDTTLVRRLMARFLTLDGHAVIEAESLAQGLEQAQRNELDLVLLDLHLPDGDGLSLLERWPVERPRPPVIVTTAGGTRETKERVKQTRVTVLRKPIAVSELRAAIFQACGDAGFRKSPNDFDAEMAEIAQDARKEITKRTAELVDLVRSDGSRSVVQQHAHKLAGLAAQFDVPLIAEAADRIERAYENGMAAKDFIADLELSLATASK